MNCLICPNRIYSQNTHGYCRRHRELSKKRKIHAKVTNRDWQVKYPGKANAKAMKHRASKLQATPKWLSKEQVKEIEQFYTEASELNWLSEGGLHVDHIVPLQGDNVSGLHVPWNLQIIPAHDNLMKGNRFHG